MGLWRGFRATLTRLHSSFYGLLDILSGTELNAGQREIGELATGQIIYYNNRLPMPLVQTAKQSCELLLKVRVQDDHLVGELAAKDYVDHRLYLGLQQARG